MKTTKTMKKLFFAAVLAASTMSYAQVGIGTETPSASLHILKNSSNTFADGLILPRLKGPDVLDKVTNGAYIAAQNGLLVQIVSGVDLTGVTDAKVLYAFEKFDGSGYYKWVWYGGASLGKGRFEPFGAKWGRLKSGKLSAFAYNNERNEVFIKAPNNNSTRPDADGELRRTTLAGGDFRIETHSDDITFISNSGNGKPSISFIRKGRSQGGVPSNAQSGDAGVIKSFIGTKEGTSLLASSIQFSSSNNNRSVAEQISKDDYSSSVLIKSSQKIASATNTKTRSGSLRVSANGVSIAGNYYDRSADDKYVSPAILNIGSNSRGVQLPVLNSAALNKLGLHKDISEGITAYCTDCSPKGIYVYNGQGFISVSNTTGNNTPLASGVIDYKSTEGGKVGTNLVVKNVIYTDNGAGAQESSFGTNNGFSYQWFINDKPTIIGATKLNTNVSANGTEYTIQSADVNKFIGVTITAQAVNGEEGSGTAYFVPVENMFNGKTYIPLRGVYDPDGDGVGEKIFFDRNLGADNVATSIDDANAVGNYYQFGRSADGHQLPNSSLYDASTTMPTSPFSVAGSAWASKFVYNIDITPDPVTNVPEVNWYEGDIDKTLWRKNEPNSPCPTHFYVPNDSSVRIEVVASVRPLDLRMGNYTDTDMTDQKAFESALKIPHSGSRRNDGNIADDSSASYLWSTGSGRQINAKALRYLSTGGGTKLTPRYEGMPVRCFFRG